MSLQLNPRYVSLLFFILRRVTSLAFSNVHPAALATHLHGFTLHQSSPSRQFLAST